MLKIDGRNNGVQLEVEARGHGIHKVYDSINGMGCVKSAATGWPVVGSVFVSHGNYQC